MLCQELNYILILAFGKKNYGNKPENLAIAGRSENGNVTVCGCSKCVNCLGPLIMDPDPYLVGVHAVPVPHGPDGPVLRLPYPGRYKVVSTT